MYPGFFAAVPHVSLSAEPLFKLGPLTVTNSILYGVICSAFIVWIIIRAARRITLIPQKGVFHNMIEYLVDLSITMLEGVFGSRKRSVEFAPYFGVYFIFVIFTNLLELVPWVGQSLFFKGSEGHIELFRPFTSDLNGTLAMAIIAIISVQYMSIKRQGVKHHLEHYFGSHPANPFNFLMGLLEVFGELTRVMSLSLRLFLNTAVGTILITVFSSIVLAAGRTPLAVIPIFMFEALVAFIQAYVFMMLAATYLGLAVGHTPYEDDHHVQMPKQVERAKT